MEAERNFPQPPFLNVSERVAVHAVPVGIGGEAKSAVGLLAAAAATEKNASIAGNLVAGDGDILECVLLHSVAVCIEGGHGEACQHVVFGVRHGVDVESSYAIGYCADFSLL